VPDSPPGSGQAAAPDAADNLYQTAGYDELLALLRRKLSGAGGETLAALARIAASRPELAIALARDLGRTDLEKNAWVGEIVRQWAGRDPQPAWAWLTQPANPLASSPLLGIVMNAMAGSNPEMLLANVDQLLLKDDSTGSPFSARNSVYLGLQALVKSGNADLAQAAVESWSNDPRHPPIGAAAYELVALGMDKSAPDKTVAWLQSLPVSDDRNAALGTLAVAWGQTDPAGAIRWAETIAPEEGRSDVVSRIFSEWSKIDSTAALSWMDDYMSRNPAFAGDDTMIGSLVLFSSTTKNDPARALKLAALISDPKTQGIYVSQVFQSWGRRDPAAAMNYLQQSTSIDPAQKQQLRQQIQGAQSTDRSEQ
jgi:hypothetical protein